MFDRISYAKIINSPYRLLIHFRLTSGVQFRFQWRRTFSVNLQCTSKLILSRRAVSVAIIYLFTLADPVHSSINFCGSRFIYQTQNNISCHVCPYPMPRPISVVSMFSLTVWILFPGTVKHSGST